MENTISDFIFIYLSVLFASSFIMLKVLGWVYSFDGSTTTSLVFVFLDFGVPQYLVLRRCPRASFLRAVGILEINIDIIKYITFKRFDLPKILCVFDYFKLFPLIFLILQSGEGNYSHFCMLN